MDLVMAEEKRLQVPALGEWYEDLLSIDSVVNNRTKVVQAQSLLCSKLQERESLINKRVEYLARKRGLTFESMWDQILTGTYQKLSPEDYKEVLEAHPDASTVNPT
jgi:hypothetical protein